MVNHITAPKVNVVCHELMSLVVLSTPFSVARAVAGDGELRTAAGTWPRHSSAGLRRR